MGSTTGLIEPDLLLINVTNVTGTDTPELPTELRRATKRPNKITCDPGAYKNLGILHEQYETPKHRITGYAIEFAVNNWDHFLSFIEEEERRAAATQALNDELDLTDYAEIHLNWDDALGGFRAVLKDGREKELLSIIEKHGEWTVEDL